MHTLRIAMGIAWAVFWAGWLLSAFTAKRSVARGWGRLGPRGIAAVAVTVEERNLTATFATAYPAYRARMRMLIPLVL